MMRDLGLWEKLGSGEIVRLLWNPKTRELLERKEGIEKVIGRYPENALPPPVPGVLFGGYEKLKDSVKFSLRFDDVFKDSTNKLRKRTVVFLSLFPDPS